MFVGMLQSPILDGKKWRSVMGDDYFSAINLIACVKDIADSILCHAAIKKKNCALSPMLTKHANPFCRAKSVVYMSCSMHYFVAIQFVALVNGLHMQRM
jgi:hypothetical protein